MQAILPIATQGARAGVRPQLASGARPALWAAIVAILAATTAVLLASGLAIAMNLS